MTWSEFSTWLAENVKPALESFIVGLFVAFAQYALSGGDLSYRALIAFVASFAANYLTSKARRTNAKQLKAQSKEALQQVSLERDIANKTAAKAQGQGQ